MTICLHSPVFYILLYRQACREEEVKYKIPLGSACVKERILISFLFKTKDILLRLLYLNTWERILEGINFIGK